MFAIGFYFFDEDYDH